LADNPGAWVLHCHELHHADGGMIASFVYDGFTPTLEKIEGSTKNVGPGHSMHGG
jgi:hypothetical protein